MLIYLYFYILFLFTYIYASDAIMLEYHLVKLQYYIPISVVDVFKDKYILVDINNNNSYFHINNTYINNIIEVYYNKYLPAVNACLDTKLFIIRNKQFYYTYYNVLHKDLYFNDVIGLGNTYNNIIYTLMNQYIISSANILFTPSINSKGKVYIGKYNKELLIDTNYSNYFNCKSKDNWGCIVNKIKIGNTTVLNSPTYFHISTSTTAIIVPDEVMIYLNNTYFNKYIESGDCKLDWNSYSKLFTCNGHAVNNFPDIYIYINGYKVKFNPKYYFYFFIDTYYLNIIGDVNKRNTYILGTIFLESVYFELNYNNNTINFYTNMPVSSNNTLNISEVYISDYYIRLIMIVNNIILISGIIIIILLLNKE